MWLVRSPLKSQQLFGAGSRQVGVWNAMSEPVLLAEFTGKQEVGRPAMPDPTSDARSNFSIADHPLETASVLRMTLMAARPVVQSSASPAD